MYAYCTSSHMSKQFKKWPIKYHFGWLSWPAKTHIKYCTLLYGWDNPPTVFKPSNIWS